MKEKLTLYNTLKKYNYKFRLHMPGHKGGKLIKKLFGKAASMDITELPFSDNLLKAEGVIKRLKNTALMFTVPQR
jgi:arginine/lysine/ornithine decarboxylase